MGYDGAMAERGRIAALGKIEVTTLILTRDEDGAWAFVQLTWSR